MTIEAIYIDTLIVDVPTAGADAVVHVGRAASAPPSRQRAATRENQPA